MKYSWTSEGITAVKNKAKAGVVFSSIWDNHVGYDDFDVTRYGPDGEIVSIVINDKVFEAGKGPFLRYWCLYTTLDIKNFFKKNEEQEDKNYWVITISPNDRPTASSGPFAKEKADEFAIRQLKNAVDGVRVIVTKTCGEAYSEYGVK